MAQRESLARGALVLAAAGILIRLSGFAYRVPLARWLQDEGLGIYQLAEPALWAFYAVAVGGVPVALGTLVAEYTARGRPHVAEQAMALAMRWTVLVSAAAAVLMFASAGLVAGILGEPRVRWTLMVLAPAAFLFATQACYRWYLQGRQLMTPSAVANLLEQGGRIAGALGGAWVLSRRGLEWAAAGVAVGAVAGGILSDIFLVLVYRRVRCRVRVRWDPGEPQRRLAWRIFVLAWPVTLAGLILPALNFADVTLIQRGLTGLGLSRGDATALYGQFRGMVYPLVTLPAVLTGALATALAPLVTAAWARGDVDAVRHRCLQGVRATALIGLPASLGLMVLAGPAVQAIYAAPAAAPLLTWAAPIALLYPLHGMLAAALNGVGHTGAPVRHITIAMAAKVVADAAVVRIPGVGMPGVAVSSVMMYLLCAWLDLRVLERHLGWRVPWRTVLSGPLLAAAGMAAGVLVLLARGWAGPGPWAALGVSLLAAPILYATILGLSGGLTRADLRDLAGPAADRLERWLHWPW